MEMKTEDILKAYKESPTAEKLTILSELNGCSRYSIAEILNENGLKTSRSLEYYKKRERSDMEKIVQAAHTGKGRKIKEAAPKQEPVEEKQEEKPACEKIPEGIVSILMDKIEALDDEFAELSRKKKELEELQAEKEKQYAEICRFLGIGVKKTAP